jgi:uncharacterized membrane protein
LNPTGPLDKRTAATFNEEVQGVLIFWCVAAMHVLAGAAWFGAMFYSLTVLHPRARRFFGDNAKFEDFIASISQGARWKVLGALGLIAVSGATLMILLVRLGLSRGWWILIGVKIVLFLTALVIFWYASWRLWPMRIFASAEELPGIHRRFAAVGIALILIASASMALGLLAHLVR